MTLYWPETPAKIDLTQPRLHAFVIGVADYYHLIGGGPNAANVNFGLQQLTTTRFTAKRIAKWLASTHKHPDCPLGSVELLLSPAEPVDRPDGTPAPIDASTMKNIRTAFEDWKTRCDSHEGNIALFYFAGHGISTTSQYLLAADFADPALAKVWENSIDFDGMRVGMRKIKADTQLFFVDACRETPIDALIALGPKGDPLIDATIFDQVTSSGAYYAAADGKLAYGPDDDITYFATAVLEALDGAGANRKGGKTVVDTFSLGNAIGQIMESLAGIHNKPLSCTPVPAGTPAVIHHPKEVLVRTVISCQSDAAKAEAAIKVHRPTMNHQSPAGEPRPWTKHIPPGEWDIDLTFTNFPNRSQHETLMPPVYEWEVEV